jgi:hypothetical protein
MEGELEVQHALLKQRCSAALGNTVVRNENASHISSTEVLCSNRIHDGGRNGSAAHSSQTEVLCKAQNPWTK